MAIQPTAFPARNGNLPKLWSSFPNFWGQNIKVTSTDNSTTTPSTTFQTSQKEILNLQPYQLLYIMVIIDIPWISPASVQLYPHLYVTWKVISPPVLRYSLNYYLGVSQNRGTLIHHPKSEHLSTETAHNFMANLRYPAKKTDIFLAGERR